MRKDQKNIKIAFLLALTLIFWASAFVCIKYLVVSYPPLYIAFIRFALASILFIVIAKLYNIKLPSKEKFLIVLSGIFGITIYNISLNYAETVISSAESSFIVNLVPIFTTFLATIFLNEKIDKIFILSILLSFTGVFLISYSHLENFSLNSGVMYALLASLSQAIYFILQKKLLSYYKPIEIVSYSVWIGTIFMIPFCVELFSFKSIHIDLSHILVFLYLSLFPSTLAYLFWTYILSTKTASTASAYLYLVPVITLFMGYYILDERINIISLLGIVMIIVGVNFKRILHYL